MAADAAYAKRVLLACNGGADAVSRGVAVGLASHGCRLVLVGDEGALAATAEEARSCAAGGAAAVAVVGPDLAACDEAAVGAAVDAAWRCFGDGGLEALVNCCSYEGEVQDCLSVTEDEYNKTMKVNVITPWLLIKAIAWYTSNSEYPPSPPPLQSRVQTRSSSRAGARRTGWPGRPTLRLEELVPDSNGNGMHHQAEDNSLFTDSGPVLPDSPR